MEGQRKQTIRVHTDLQVYQTAFALAMRIFQLSASFPREERYSLTDQIRRSSRSVCTNIAEGWRKRRYPAAFVSKLADAEGEAAETQVWLDFARECGYLDPAVANELRSEYNDVIGMLVKMRTHPEQWTL